MITVSVDDSRLRARLFAMPDRVRAALYRRVSALAVQLADRVRRKLSGEVLQVRTGRLRASIFEDVRQGKSSVEARVASSGDVKYAGIHEYGGTIPAHVVVPSKARALHWLAPSGASVFATRASIPAVTMPERSFLRSSLAEMRAQIVEELTEAVREGSGA